ncbi:MAG: sugar kinase [Promethearchaeati archaeon SRVP18_Atabeyarchaeia-1]
MDIVALGECMIEFFCNGSISEARTFEASAAGDTLNTIVAASRLGSRCGFITKVGGDAFGDFLINRWKSENIDTSHAAVRTDGFNGIYFISLQPNGQREFIYYRKGSAASTITPQDLDPAYIGSAKILHTSGISQAISETSLATVEEAIHIARKRNVKVSFDPNYRPKLWSKENALKAYEAILPQVDIAFPDETYGALINEAKPREILKYFAKFEIPIIALKLGEKGTFVQGLEKEAKSCGVLNVGVKDTTGAGDAFNGGFLHAVCEGLSLEDAAILGTITAGLKVTGRGAVGSLPHRGDVYRLLKAVKSGKKRLV